MNNKIAYSLILLLFIKSIMFSASSNTLILYYFENGINVEQNVYFVDVYAEIGTKIFLTNKKKIKKIFSGNKYFGNILEKNGYLHVLPGQIGENTSLTIIFDTGEYVKLILKYIKCKTSYKNIHIKFLKQ